MAPLQEYILKKNKKMIFLLPGPPAEMEPMLLQKVVPEVTQLINKKLYFETVQTIGVPESDLQGIVDKIIGTVHGIDIAYRVNLGVCELTIYGYDKELVGDQTNKIRNYLGSSALTKGI